jgi:histidine triad (HIT) family protein
MSTDCVFCRIAAGTLPSTRVYEDADTIAFMDINPVVKGHVLVVPKKHYDPLVETPPEVLQKLIVVVQRIARAQIESLGAIGLNVTQANGEVAGQLVPHIHFHVIPRFESDKHERRWAPGRYENSEDIERFAGKIRKVIR